MASTPVSTCARGGFCRTILSSARSFKFSMGVMSVPPKNRAEVCAGFRMISLMDCSSLTEDGADRKGLPSISSVSRFESSLISIGTDTMVLSLILRYLSFFSFRTSGGRKDILLLLRLSRTIRSQCLIDGGRARRIFVLTFSTCRLTRLPISGGSCSMRLWLISNCNMLLQYVTAVGSSLRLLFEASKVSSIKIRKTLRGM